MPKTIFALAVCCLCIAAIFFSARWWSRYLRASIAAREVVASKYGDIRQASWAPISQGRMRFDYARSDDPQMSASVIVRFIDGDPVATETGLPE